LGWEESSAIESISHRLPQPVIEAGPILVVKPDADLISTCLKRAEWIPSAESNSMKQSSSPSADASQRSG
jgi:hypothetical protein